MRIFLPFLRLRVGSEKDQECIDLDAQIAQIRQPQQRLQADNVMRGSFPHHPARHMRQRPVRLANNKHLRSCETLPLEDLHALTVARVIPIKDPPVGVVIWAVCPWFDRNRQDAFGDGDRAQP